MNANEQLDERRLRKFATALRKSKTKRVKSEVLWAAFSSSFPTMSQSVERRVWFLAALQELENQSIIELPSESGALWDDSMATKIPKSVVLIRESLTRTRSWKTFPWHQSLAWVASQDHIKPETEEFLMRVHEGLVSGSFSEVAPLKYRSLQLTGKEKRLGELAKTKLFGEDRLSFELLGCLAEVPPMAFETVGDRRSILIFENADSFSIARNILREKSDPPYGFVGFGGGNGIVKSLAYLNTIQPPLSEIHYVGDLDYFGLEIARRVTKAAVVAGLPPVLPAHSLHLAMLESAEKFGNKNGWADETKLQPSPNQIASVVEFLPPNCRNPVAKLISMKRRIPEEVLGPIEFNNVWTS